MIYLACPYAHQNPLVIKARVLAITKVAAALMHEGHVVFSPLTMSHYIDKYGNFPRTWEFWQTIDLPFLANCDALYILTLPGWEQSVGVNGEIEFANMNEIPITYIKYEDYK